MKKLFLLMFLLFLFCSNVYAAIVRDIADTHRLSYTIIDADGNPISGQAVTLRIHKASTSDWYDFSDKTFKQSPIQSTINLSYDPTGEYYFYDFSPPPSETQTEQYIFIIDNVSSDYGDHQQEVVNYQAIASPDDVTVYVGE